MNAQQAVVYLRNLMEKVQETLPDNPMWQELEDAINNTEHLAKLPKGQVKPAPAAYLVTMKKPGTCTTFATLPGYHLEPGWTLVREEPLVMGSVVPNAPDTKEESRTTVDTDKFKALLMSWYEEAKEFNGSFGGAYQEVVEYVDTLLPQRLLPVVPVQNESYERHLFNSYLLRKLGQKALLDDKGNFIESWTAAAFEGWMGRAEHGHSVTLNARQLYEAAALANPEGSATDDDCMNYTEVTLTNRMAFDASDEDGHPVRCEAGIYLHYTEYPEEGVLFLSPDPDPKAAQAVDSE